MNTEPLPQDDTAPEIPAPLEDAVTPDLENQIEILTAELEQLRAQSLIDRADLENQRKRLTREAETARRFANERLLDDLLPVFDSLDAGLASLDEDTENPLREGLELTRQQLLKVTHENGLTEVNPAGEAFNPEHHQAISQAPADGTPPGHVVQVFQKGYLLNGRLLRPALVVVAQEA